MAGQTLFERYELLVAAAIIGAHANAIKGGFRLRDVRVLIEFFTNWIEATLEEQGIPLENTQIKRYLDNLVVEGFARKISSRWYPQYRLTRTGLIELVSCVVRKPYYPQKEHFFFLYSFIENYRPRITSMIKKEGNKFPYALQLELEGLLDLNALLDKQLYFARRELKKLEKRIADQVQIAKLASELTQKNLDFRRITREVERQFPYSLSTTKQFSQLMLQATEKQVLWELCVGGLRRTEQIWEPTRELLLLHIEQLSRLKKSAPQSGKNPVSM